MGGCASKSKAAADDSTKEGESQQPTDLISVEEDGGDLGDEIHKVVFPHACEAEKMDQALLRTLKPKHGLSELFTKFSRADCGPLTDIVAKHFENHVYFDSEVNDTFIVLTWLWEGTSSEGAGSYFVVEDQETSMLTLLRLAVEKSWQTEEHKPFLIVPIGVTLYEGKLSDERFDSQYDLSPAAVPPGADLVFLPKDSVIVAREFTDLVMAQLPSAAGISSTEELQSFDKVTLDPVMKLLVVKTLKEFDANAFEAVEKVFRKQWQARISKRVEIKFPQLNITERTLKPNQVSELPEQVRTKLESSDVSWIKRYVGTVRTRFFVMRYHVAKKMIVRRIMTERPAGSKNSPKSKSSPKKPKRTNK